MFNFAMSSDELDDDDALNFGQANVGAPVNDASSSEEELMVTLNVNDLLSKLPPVISYAPLSVKLSGTDETITLHRRDLFDARFQLLSDEDEGGRNAAALKVIDNPSDLVSGIYEGGMKTWECSFDLVDHLHSELPRLRQKDTKWPYGKRILELGCGTAIPTLYILHQLFRSLLPENGPKTVVHLQDYNRSVLELVTLPNILLTWYHSPLSISYRATPDPDVDAEGDAEVNSQADRGTDLHITTTLIAAFTASLAASHITLGLFAGSWSAFVSAPDSALRHSYDVVLTSETVYRPQSLRSLIGLLKSAGCGTGMSDVGPAAGLESLHISSPASETLSSSVKTSLQTPICLVAAKVLYFGVGGGVVDFERAAVSAGGRVRCVWEKTAGVGRKILQVDW